MIKLDQSRLLSEADGGGFLEVATLWEGHDGKIYLQVNAGYGSEGENDESWYRLSSRPPGPLGGYASKLWLDPVADQTKFFTETFGVDATLTKNPWTQTKNSQ